MPPASRPCSRGPDVDDRRTAPERRCCSSVGSSRNRRLGGRSAGTGWPQRLSGRSEPEATASCTLRRTNRKSRMETRSRPRGPELGTELTGRNEARLTGTASPGSQPCCRRGARTDSFDGAERTLQRDDGRLAEARRRATREAADDEVPKRVRGSTRWSERLSRRAQREELAGRSRSKPVVSRRTDSMLLSSSSRTPPRGALASTAMKRPTGGRRHGSPESAYPNEGGGARKVRGAKW